MNLSATSTTWDLGGSTFLMFYLALAVLTLGIAVVQRRRLLAGPATVRTSDLTPAQVAYLSGGPRLAVYTALAALRHAGAVGVGPAPDRHLIVAGPRPIGATNLEAAIYGAAGGRLKPYQLAADSGVSMELTRLRTELQRAGLLPNADVQRSLLTWSRALLGVQLLGAVWLLVGFVNDRPLLPLIVLVVPFSAVAVLLRRPSVRTRAGDQALATLRQEHAHLAPTHRPAWNTYGPTGVAMSVAMFGTAAIWAADPQFAGEAEIEQRMGAGSGGSGWNGGADAGSSGSCGGSSGDGGGSSCGGGGGCGGGSGG
jgi:uncharacterized protein (TIGR04222 family)